MVARGELSAGARRALDLWAGCVSGSITESEYAAALSGAGFESVSFETVSEQRLAGVGTIASAHIRARRPDASAKGGAR